MENVLNGDATFDMCIALVPLTGGAGGRGCACWMEQTQLAMAAGYPDSTLDQCCQTFSFNNRPTLQHASQLRCGDPQPQCLGTGHTKMTNTRPYANNLRASL
ncbi:hypothetical protein J1605_011301 [Eschrichtius robustus]|uniref:Uncharacterized protein n=1 Tax=Eschrichtius robustus TaxID=9764 RepID=A0AB34GQ57_ESCRO|nr:hypothetical protein J1605_011301 [Eschrichtius robustus]